MGRSRVAHKRHQVQTTNTFRADRWRRCLDCGCSVPRGEPHPCFKRGSFAAYTLGFLGALAFGIGAACIAAEMFQ